MGLMSVRPMFEDFLLSDAAAVLHQIDPYATNITADDILVRQSAAKG